MIDRGNVLPLTRQALSTAAEFSPEVANGISPLRCGLLLVKGLPLCLRLPSAVDPGVWAVRLGEG